MTEQEWLTCTDPRPMLEFLRGRANSRKFRLFICACCRRGTDNIRSTRHQEGLDVAERYADGVASDDERHAAYQGTRFRKKKDWTQMNYEALANNALAPDDALSPLNVPSRINNPRARAFQTAMLRCLFGNPFRPVAADPAWLTSTVLALAAGIYEERAFERMPILADALQDAGCDNDDILNHCRDEKGTHARGCWVVDLLLGKE